MNNRALAAEAFGTFMLMSAILGSAFYSFGAPSGAAGILGAAFSIVITVMVTALAIGHVSGGHYNPASCHPRRPVRQKATRRMISH
jgi:aquaporin Z